MKIQTFAATSLLLGSLVLSSSAKPVSKRAVTIVRNGVITVKSHDKFLSFHARRGQTIRASVVSKTSGYAPLLFITAPSGLNLTQSKETSYKAKLPETGFYQVRVGTNQMASENSGNSAYHLEIRVR